MSKSNLVDITVIVVAETEKAYKIDAGDGVQHWVPKSQVELTPVSGKRNLFEITMPEWLAIDKGLV